MQTVPYGQVALEPHFLCAENHAEVGFKIGMDTKYVLKDVFEFARYVKSGDEHAYGKKLNFLHTPEAFDPLSQKLLNFILSWVQENGSYYLTYQYYSYTETFSPLRRIPLGGAEFEELLSILKDNPVLIDLNGSGEKIWRQTDAVLSRHMRLLGKPEGLEVEIEPLAEFYAAHTIFTFRDGLIYRENRENLLPLQDFLACLPELAGTGFYVEKDRKSVV